MGSTASVYKFCPNEYKQKLQKSTKLTSGQAREDNKDEDISNLKEKSTETFSRISKEVYKLANSGKSISEKVTHALKVIEESLKRYGPDGVSLSFNGGKDCVVLLHLFVAAYYKYFQDSDEIPNIPTVYITHPNPFLEVEDFVDDCVDRYCLDLIRIEGPMKPALSKYLEKCPEIKAILVGVRRNDPYGEKLSAFDPTDPGWPPFMRVHPILDWHYTQIWEYLRTLNVSYCVLYDLGYTSLGSIDNTFPNPDLKNPLQPNGYDPAWKLTDEGKERCGRENKKQKETSSSKPLSVSSQEEISLLKSPLQEETSLSKSSLQEEISLSKPSSILSQKKISSKLLSMPSSKLPLISRK